ncbi:uncharacterized protein LOC143462845 isoform X1 [Clavelina lepadiformis]|uniref:uncharacterized protein LOC143462845 isoform X1 n=1 Tax=Clavelina lepadiformis TaxID=159417 RepID=UPI004040EEEC
MDNQMTVTYCPNDGKYLAQTSPYPIESSSLLPSDITWVQQMTNGAAVYVPVYTVNESHQQIYQYYPQPGYGPYEYRPGAHICQPRPFIQYQATYHQLPVACPMLGHNATFMTEQSVERSKLVGKVRNSFSTTSSSDECKQTRKVITHEQESPKVYQIPKRETRCDSADSGISDSPSSLRSSGSWSSDDSNLDSDSSEQIKAEQNRILSTNNESSDCDMKTDPFVTSTEDKENYDHCWTVVDDDKYWAQQRHRIPDNFTLNAIAKQVDYYLSDDYLVKDKYLLRQIRCKKDGYISIKLITSFKKVKKLTRDWAVVRSAIVRKSSTIFVSSEGLRVRRKTNLSEYLRKPRLLTSVLVIRLPDEYNSVDRVTSLFNNFGEIEYVRLLRADREVPADLRNYATQVHDIGVSLCAIIDFESAEDALTAVRVLKFFQRQTGSSMDGERQEEGVTSQDEPSLATIKFKEILKDLPALQDMRLALLGPRVRRTLYRQDRLGGDQSQNPSSFKPPRSFLASDLELKHKANLGREDSVTDTAFDFSRKPKIEPRHLSNYCYITKHNSLSHNFSCRRSAVKGTSYKVIPNQCYVIRQPRGPDQSIGFTLKRNL